jgi:hypothetical protein
VVKVFPRIQKPSSLSPLELLLSKAGKTLKVFTISNLKHSW